MHGRFVGLAVEPGLGIGQPVAGQLDLFAHHHRHTAAFRIALAAERRLAGGDGRDFFGGLADHAQLQRRGAAEDAFHLRRVLHAGQLHHDAVETLLLDDGLGHTERVDAVVEGGDVLLDGGFLHATFRLGFDDGGQPQVRAVAAVGQRQIRQRIGHRVARAAAIVGVAKLDGDGAALPVDADMTHVLVAQQGAQVAGQRIELFGQRRLHVDLIKKVHTAAQVQAQVHRQRVQAGEPLGGIRQQVEGDGERFVAVLGVRLFLVRVERAVDQVLRLQLGIGILEARLDAVAIEEQAGMFGAPGLERGFNPGTHALVHLEGGLGA